MDLQMKTIRTMRKLSQEEVAKAAHMPIRRYGSYERGERKISLHDAALIADVLECSLDELAGRRWDAGRYADGGQEQLNRSYRLLNDDSKRDLVKFAKSYAADPERRVVKEGQPGDVGRAG